MLEPSSVEVEVEPLSSHTHAISLAVRRRQPRVIVVMWGKIQRQHHTGSALVMDIGIQVEDTGL
jgi:hypothetical protein